MRIVFVSNYYNHHQSELARALLVETEGNYTFIQTKPMGQERVKLGWGTELPDFVKCSYESDADYEKCVELINAADVVIAGSAPEKMLSKRIAGGKLILRYSERIFKKKDSDILRRIKYTKRVLPQRNKNVYYLCSSAYAAGDYCRCGAKKEKCYRWGYFTFVAKYVDVEKLIQKKKPTSILWAGRLISWKHPDAVIEVAKRLKQENYAFDINVIGTGEMEETLKKSISDAGLDGQVHMLGAMKPGEVRAHMEQSAIYLFTSDRGEGWGAVLNESMNSACAVVASHAIGATPFLVQDGEIGMIYRDGDVDELYSKVKWLLDHEQERQALGRAAYDTMVTLWNADVAAHRLVNLAKSLLEKDGSATYQSGPCSAAPILKC